MKIYLFTKYTNGLLILLMLPFYITVPASPQPSGYNLDFHTQYNQFYLCDKKSPMRTDVKSFWGEGAYEDRLATEAGLLGIHTFSYGHIRCKLVILDKANASVNFAKCSHVVEAGINIPSGVLRVITCPINKVELEIKIKPGNYRARIYSYGSSANDINEDEGNDHYKIELWPDNKMQRTVLKRYLVNQSSQSTGHKH